MSGRHKKRVAAEPSTAVATVDAERELRREPGNPEGKNQFTDPNPLAPMDYRQATALVLLEQGATGTEVRNVTGLSKRTIDRIRKHGEAGCRASGRLISVLRDQTEAKLTALHHKTLDHMMTNADEALAKASWKDLALTAGILQDKLALLRGEPTEIRELRGMSDDQIREEVQSIVRELHEAGALDARELRDAIEADFEPVASGEPVGEPEDEGPTLVEDLP